MSWIIYKHTNLQNGKVYIGQTCQRPEDRWLNGHGYPNNKHFDRAIKKYGWKTGFSHEILVENIPTLEEANKLEIEYIEKYNSYVKSPNSNGYNLTKGGDNRDNFSKIVLQIDDDFNIVNSYVSIGAAGRAIGDYGGTGVSACCRRINAKCKGFYFCYADDYNTNWRPKEDEHSKPVICLDTGKHYDRINDYEKETGFTVHRYNNELHANGMRFVYVNEYTDEIRNEYLRKKKERVESLKIICYETKKEYRDVRAAALDLSISERRIPNIFKSLKDSGYSVNGFHFVYKTKYTPNWKPRELKQKKKAIIVCIETGEEFKTLSDAAKAKHASLSEIGKCCKDLSGKYTSGGFHWCYKENLDSFTIKEYFTGKPVYCFENKKHYPNAELAANELRLSANSIRNCCKKIYHSAGKYHFCYANEIESYEIIPNREGRNVFCIEQNRVYKSTDEAAKINKLSSGAIYNVCKKKKGCLTCGGLHWCFEDEKDSFEFPARKIKKVLCVETNEIFDNCKDAERAKGAHSSKIGAVCLGKRKTAGGYHWKHVN